MNWIKRSAAKTIAEVVAENTHIPTEEFLDETPTRLRIDGLDKAAEMIREAINDDAPITIVGDYDVDGICASTILFLTLKHLGKEPVVRLPRRFSEGYGLSEKIVDEISSGLLITVDNGIAAVDAIQKAKDKGLKVLLTDHHLPNENGDIPCADIVIDPNAIPGSADFNGYCGAGLAYRLSLELIGDENKLAPKCLSFAAIATVADVMELVSENRQIVRKGLVSMTTYNGRTTGLGSLLKLCELDSFVSAKNIGFKIAPILNAPGRLEDDGAMKSFQLLSFNGSKLVSDKKAQELIDINELRKQKKEEGLIVLHENISNNCLYGDCPLCIYEPGLPEGLIGIYAGQLAEEFKVPCFVFTDSSEPGILKGSGRSYGNIHLKDMLDKNADLLYKYGGHAEAAGVSVLEENFEDMKAAFSDSILIHIEDDDTAYYDLKISADQIPQAIKELEKFAPFGQGNPEIVFRIDNFMLSPGYSGYYRVMGSDGKIIKFFGTNAEAIGFGLTEKYLEMKEPRVINLLGTLSTNYYRGEEKNQIELVDFCPAVQKLSKTPLASMLAEKSSARYKK